MTIQESEPEQFESKESTHFGFVPNDISTPQRYGQITDNG
jgi:hypothetical protein